MHESSLARNLLAAALKKAAGKGARRIVAVHGWVADCEALSSASLGFHLAAHAKDTIAEGACFDIRVIHVSARCGDCGDTFTPGGHAVICPKCGSVETTLVERTGIGIDTIDIESGDDR